MRINQAYRAVVFTRRIPQRMCSPGWTITTKLTAGPSANSLSFIRLRGPCRCSARNRRTPCRLRAHRLLPRPGLFARVKDKHLLRRGVPEEFIPLVRSIAQTPSWRPPRTRLPQEAYEALYMLASGYSPDEVFREMEKPEEEIPVDRKDFVAALQNEDSKRRFYVIDEAKDLAEVLNAPLDQWRIFLHPKQRRLVSMQANGPIRVLGGAGTGKTVVAMHRARLSGGGRLQQERRPHPLTTFTRNLATDIQENLRKLCSVDALSRIDVVNLDAWVANFLRGQGYRHQVVFDEDENDAWAFALNQAPPDLGVAPNFYRSEWEQVIQAQNITDADQYLKASRIGRGTKLTRDAKKRIWPVFQEYRAQLNEQGKKEYIDLVRDARGLIQSKGITLPYRAVIVDEAQDMSAEAFRLMRAIVAETHNDLFIVGDAHQRIYRHRVSLGQCGINIKGRGKKLKINYRTTDEIRRFAVCLLEGRDSRRS